MTTLIASASIDIAAPIEVVWSVLVDFRRYVEWNPFIVDVRPIPQPLVLGSRFQLHVRWADGGAARSGETVTHLAPPTRGDGGLLTAVLAYRYSDWQAWTGLVRATREQRLTQGVGQPTHYQTQETFHGALARYIPLAAVQDGFHRQAEALRRRALALAGQPDGVPR